MVDIFFGSIGTLSILLLVSGFLMFYIFGLWAPEPNIYSVSGSILAFLSMSWSNVLLVVCVIASLVMSHFYRNGERFISSKLYLFAYIMIVLLTYSYWIYWMFVGVN